MVVEKGNEENYKTIKRKKKPVLEERKDEINSKKRPRCLENIQICHIHKIMKWIQPDLS